MSRAEHMVMVTIAAVCVMGPTTDHVSNRLWWHRRAPLSTSWPWPTSVAPSSPVLTLSLQYILIPTPRRSSHNWTSAKNCKIFTSVYYQCFEWMLANKKCLQFAQPRQITRSLHRLWAAELSWTVGGQDQWEDWMIVLQESQLTSQHTIQDWVETEGLRNGNIGTRPQPRWKQWVDHSQDENSGITPEEPGLLWPNSIRHSQRR